MDNSGTITRQPAEERERSGLSGECEAAHEPLTAVLESVADAIFIHDAAGSIEHVNSNSLAMFGMETRELMRSQSAAGYYGALVDSQVLEQIWLEVLGGSVRKFEWQIRRASDGELFDAEICLRTIRLRGRDLILATVRDVTASKILVRELADARAESRHLHAQAEAASVAKTEFLATMSHELRTPLTAVIGLSEILGDQMFGPLNERQLEYTQEIVSAGRLLLQLINDILDLAKVESGKMILQRNPIKLGSLLSYCLITLKEKADRRGLTLSLVLDASLEHALVFADEAKLKQIVTNLLSNAAKFTADRGAITLAARATEDHVVISVTDTGIGLNPADRERIFEVFRQVDASYTRTREGTGLGLGLTKRLVELHGGRIWVESEGIGKGCSFHFTIPLLQPGDALI